MVEFEGGTQMIPKIPVWETGKRMSSSVLIVEMSGHASWERISFQL